jgi:hypothetical protein
MCMVDDSEPWEFYTESHVKAARKEHRCTECRRIIYVGEGYRRSMGKFDGDFHVYAMCPHCESASQWLVKACSGYMFCAVLEDLAEHWEESESYRSPMLRWLIDHMRVGWNAGEDPIPNPRAVTASVPTARRSVSVYA